MEGNDEDPNYLSKTTKWINSRKERNQYIFDCKTKGERIEYKHQQEQTNNDQILNNGNDNLTEMKIELDVLLKDETSNGVLEKFSMIDISKLSRLQFYHVSRYITEFLETEIFKIFSKKYENHIEDVCSDIDVYTENYFPVIIEHFWKTAFSFMNQISICVQTKLEDLLSDIIICWMVITKLIVLEYMSKQTPDSLPNINSLNLSLNEKTALVVEDPKLSISDFSLSSCISVTHAITRYLTYGHMTKAVIQLISLIHTRMCILSVFKFTRDTLDTEDYCDSYEYSDRELEGLDNDINLDKYNQNGNSNNNTGEYEEGRERIKPKQKQKNSTNNVEKAQYKKQIQGESSVTRTTKYCVNDKFFQQFGLLFCSLYKIIKKFEYICNSCESVSYDIKDTIEQSKLKYLLHKSELNLSQYTKDFIYEKLPHEFIQCGEYELFIMKNRVLYDYQHVLSKLYPNIITDIENKIMKPLLKTVITDGEMRIKNFKHAEYRLYFIALNQIALGITIATFRKFNVDYTFFGFMRNDIEYNLKSLFNINLEKRPFILFTRSSLSSSSSTWIVIEKGLTNTYSCHIFGNALDAIYYWVLHIHEWFRSKDVISVKLTPLYESITDILNCFST